MHNLDVPISLYRSRAHTIEKCVPVQLQHLIKVLVLSPRSSSSIEFTCRRWSALVTSTLRSALTSSSCWAKWVLHNDGTYRTWMNRHFFSICTDYIRHAFIHTHGNVLSLSLIKWKWTMSAASGLPGVLACRDLCDLILCVSTLPLITGCNQWLVCWRCWASLQQMKKAIIYIIPSDYSVFLSFCLCCILQSL